MTVEPVEPSEDTPRRLFRPIASTRGGGEMAVLEFGDPGRPVDLVFVHANGFNALTYRDLLTPLAEGRRIWAPDLRGHGRSRLPLPGVQTDWSIYRDDLIALLEGLSQGPIVLAGHSMGGVSGLLAAAKRPDLVSRLVLLDPVIWPRPASLLFRLPLAGRAARRAPIVRSTLRRRADFPDRETALRAYRGRGAFKGWPDAALEDYLADGLTEAPDGGLTLSCPPWWEASNYGAQAHDPWGALRRFPGPIDLVKADIEPLSAPTAPLRPGMTVTVASGGSHMFPIQQPDFTRRTLANAL